MHLIKFLINFTFDPVLIKANKYLALISIFSLAWISSGAQLKADFDASPVAGCAPLVALFNDASTGDPTSWFWDLGNGTTSTLRTPAAIYADPGTYAVKLIVQNSLGIDSIVKQQFITVYSSPEINFAGSPLTGCFPLNTQFTDESTAGSGSLEKWEWDFGDGVISSEQNPNHTYTRLGDYNISLKATNSFGCFSFKTTPSYVHISSGAKAGFSNSIPNSCTSPATIDFTNNSIGTGTLNYQWDFGDGATSTSNNPSHTYNSGGSYTVRLIVFNSIGCTDTLVKSNLITIGTTVAGFSDSLPICKGAAYTIKNTSSPAPGSAFWDFGDGTFSDSINPVKVFADTGSFTVKMVANFGACKDSVIKTVKVLAIPAVNFSASQTASCQAPFIVNFTDSSSGGATYSWDFGDGSTSDAQNPSHSYQAEGTYTVKLFVTNASGCRDSLVKKDLIVIKSPVVTIKGLPLGGCPPLSHTFTTQVNSVDSIVSYSWDFGDGTTSDLKAPQHTYPNGGNYTVTLMYVTSGGCSGTVKMENGISVGTRPKAAFSASPLVVCASESINFTDLSTGDPDKWIWLFGDGTNSSQKNPVHQYNDTGYFSVRLTALNNGCADTVSLPDYIYVKPAVAKFTAASTCAAPQHIVFTDRSIGADSWSWDFGDGSAPSTDKNPVHDYATPGNYEVSLTVTNFSTGCSFTKTNNIRVIYEVPAFTVANTDICKNTPAVFTATTNIPANVVLYTWTFGDGSTITDSTGSVNHQYTQPGSYDVTLAVEDIKGCSNSVTIPGAIAISGPTAVFRASAAGICINTSASFFDSSYNDGTHTIQQWSWDWGDSSSQDFTAPPFNHTYTKAGNFPVSLKVTDSKGCVDSANNPKAIFVSQPVANFSADSLSCTTRSATFLNASAGQGLNYLWDFGDGTTSDQQNPVHLFGEEGLYTIRLDITDLFGCKDSISKTDYLKIANPEANFSINDSTVSCPPLVANFTNTSTDFSTSFWDFGDGSTSTARNPSHFYSTVGTFTAVLTVTGAEGCTSQKSMEIKVNGPSTSFSYSNIAGCGPLQTTFRVRAEKSLTLLWDFGDGEALRAPEPVVTHTYTTAGSYLPKMIIVDTTGCSVLLNGADSIKVAGVKASFNNSGTIVCDEGNVQFNNTSLVTNDVITDYNWSFGDGSTSVEQNPLHPYSIPGTYATTLNVITGLGCRDTITNAGNVKVIKSPQISISGDSGACIPAVLNFSGIIVAPDTSSLTWNWDFANGNSSTLIHPPSQTYATAGTFTVKAVATNSSGCDGTADKIIEIYPLPSLVTSPDTTICSGDAASLRVSGAQSYTWSPSTYLSCLNCANPFSQAAASVKYEVTGTSSHGCVSSDSVSVTVKLPFNLSISKGDTLCKGSSVQITASGAEVYTWSPSTGLNDASSSSPVASPATSTLYQVIGSDSEGCFTDTAFLPISVFPLPTVEAGADKTLNIGHQLDIVPQISEDVTSVLWTPPAGIVANNYPGITVSPTATTDYTIEVKTATGCTARDKITIYVLCNNSNVFVPNTFSPNGDGANDIFYPRGSGIFSVKNLKIFNRWGQVVFEAANFNANDASAGWDGTYKGKKLSPDVFVYTLEVVCENNTTLVFKGNIALIR